MKITVRIGSVEVVVDRPDFKDAAPAVNGPELRRNILTDTVFPVLEKAVEIAKELHKESLITSPLG